MKFSSLIFILLFLTGKMVHSGPVTVTGRVNDADGKIIRLMTYTDHISGLRQTIASDTISAEGEFSLQAEVPGTCYAWLDIGFQSAELFLKPGQVYTVEVLYNQQNITSSYYDRLGLSMEIISDDDDRTNLYIRDFNQLYNDFLLNYASGGGARNTSGAFEAFRKAIQVRFQNVKSEYVSGYIRYKTASMQLFLRLKSRDNIGLEYLSHQPVLYSNIEYMDFLQLYFEKYFIAGTKYFTFNKTNDLVNGTAALETILDSLSADPVLESRELRELLLLQGMKELYGVPGFKKSRISGLISELQVRSGFGEIREIAGHLLTRLDRLQPGTPAPEFRATTANRNEMVALSDFEGKRTYLMFFSVRNPASQSEMALARDIIMEYDQKVHFVAVSVDDDPALVRDFAGQDDILWQILVFAGTPDMLENFDATTLPHFLLIDAQGLIIRCPAPSPSENIRKLLDAG